MENADDDPRKKITLRRGDAFLYMDVPYLLVERTKHAAICLRLSDCRTVWILKIRYNALFVLLSRS